MNDAGAAPEAEERLLHGVLRQRLVAQDPVGEAVGDAADPVVELRERRFVGARDERDERLVGEVGEVAASHGDRLSVSEHASDSHERGERFDAERDRTGLGRRPNQRRQPTTRSVGNEEGNTGGRRPRSSHDLGARRRSRGLRAECRHRLESP